MATRGGQRWSRFAIFICAVAVCGCFHLQADTMRHHSAAEYYPLAEGNSWKYCAAPSTAPRASACVTWTVLSTTGSAGSDTFSVWPDPQQADDEAMSLVPSQFAVLESDSERVILRTDKLPGESWKHEEWSERRQKTLAVTFTIHAVRPVRYEYFHRGDDKPFYILVLEKWRIGGKISPTVGDAEIWLHLDTRQKSLLVSGFIHCYRTAHQSKPAFGDRDTDDMIRGVDVAIRQSQGSPSIESLILTALERAKRAVEDPGEEKWLAPYGFSDGLWWRQIRDDGRAAYVQGVYWCARGSPADTFVFKAGTIREAVRKLNAWYLVDDETYAGIGGDRVDVPAIVAMRSAGILQFRTLQ